MSCTPNRPSEAIRADSLRDGPSKFLVARCKVKLPAINYSAAVYSPLLAVRRTSAPSEKAIPQDGSGNDFGNKALVLLQTFTKAIDLAEAVRFELTEDFHPRQFSRLVHSTALPSFLFVTPSIIRKFIA